MRIPLLVDDQGLAILRARLRYHLQFEVSPSLPSCLAPAGEEAIRAAIFEEGVARIIRLPEGAQYMGHAAAAGPFLVRRMELVSFIEEMRTRRALEGAAPDGAGSVYPPAGRPEENLYVHVVVWHGGDQCGFEWYWDMNTADEVLVELQTEALVEPTGTRHLRLLAQVSGYAAARSEIGAALAAHLAAHQPKDGEGGWMPALDCRCLDLRAS